MTAKVTRGAAAAADLGALLKARNALVWVVSKEEARVERGVLDAAAAAKYDVRSWDCASGITDAGGGPVDDSARDPAAALEAIKKSRQRQVWVLRDLHLWLRDPTILRALRNLARSLPSSPRAEARAIVMVSPTGEVPPELAGHAVVVNWPLPDRAEVAAILKGVIDALPDGVERPDDATREVATDAAVGLTADEAASCYAKSLVTARKIDPAVVASEKKRVIAREKVLEWHDPDPRGLEAVGGLGVLKAWLVQRRAALSQRARDFGLPAPKGVLLVGVPGCGKSLTAKAVAAAWQVPLLRLDLGALKSKWVGESEGNLRKALAVAEAVAPAILWLDEVEKALQGATSGSADGGVSSDALGAILSWLQERSGSVFVVATCNDVRALPPELLRKGRFDEIFWVDLPTQSERAAVLETALGAHGRARDAVDVAALSEVTRDFTGAEVAALVPEALFEAFADGERAIRTEDLVRAAASTVPLARTAAEKIEAMRSWAKGRARFASLPAAGEVSRSAQAERVLDIADAIESRYGEVKPGGN